MDEMNDVWLEMLHYAKIRDEGELKFTERHSDKKRNFWLRDSGKAGERRRIQNKWQKRALIEERKFDLWKKGRHDWAYNEIIIQTKIKEIRRLISEDENSYSGTLATGGEWEFCPEELSNEELEGLLSGKFDGMNGPLNEKEKIQAKKELERRREDG